MNSESMNQRYWRREPRIKWNSTGNTRLTKPLQDTQQHVFMFKIQLVQRRPMKTIRFFANMNFSEIVDPMDVEHRPPGADLFELQIGFMEIGNGQAVWAGSLKKVYNGEKRYFKGWSGLVANLREILTPFAQLEVLNMFLQTKEVMC